MENKGPQHPGLKSLVRYPLLEALQGRRTRRVARGMSVLAEGELNYDPHPPESPFALDELEEAILICSTGLTGFVMHDGPVKKSDGKPEELGSMFMNVMGRAAPSPDNCQATSLFMFNDAGISLIKRLNPYDYLTLARKYNLPPNWSEWSEANWKDMARAMKEPLYKGPISFPRDFPFYVGWNKQLSSPKGSTIFLPVVDCTRQYINILLGLLSEPKDQRPLFVDDWQPFRPKSFTDWAAWFAQHLGLGPKIPYQPIGGIDRAKDGFVNPKIAVPLGYARMFRIESEMFFSMQNLMLLGEAMGLASWGHAAVFPPEIFRRDEEKKWKGLGFRHVTPKKPLTSAPVPAWWDNPVGIDGLLQALCPPYVKNMDEAVDIVLDEKFGENGIFKDADLFAHPYKKQTTREGGSINFGNEFLRQKQGYTDEAISYTKQICNYIYKTYGRFPAHVNAFHAPGYWLQFHHVEKGYYRKFFDEKTQWANQARHDDCWHPELKEDQQS